MSCYCTRESVDVSPADVPADTDDDVVVIFGSRSFTADRNVREGATEVLARLDKSKHGLPDVIVSGGADGADAVAEAVAVALDVPARVCAVGGVDSNTQFRADLADSPWVMSSVTSYEGSDDDPRSGRGAYLTRNCVMAETVAQHGGRGFAIWDGQSPGTEHMLDACDEHGVETSTWRFD